MKTYCVYILSNTTNSVLYIGVTNNLIRRIHEHKHEKFEGFSKKYNCKKLVYYECGNSITAVINYEKRLKNWHRAWKINLIKERNPKFQDLSAGLGFDFSQPLDPEINSG